MLYCRATSSCTHKHTQNEVMNWLIGLLFSAEALAAWGLVSCDPRQGSHEAWLQLKWCRYLSKYVHNYPLHQRWKVTRSRNSVFGSLPQHKSVLSMWCAFFCASHRSFWAFPLPQANVKVLNSRCIYLFNICNQGLGAFCMLDGTSQGSSPVAILTPKGTHTPTRPTLIKTVMLDIKSVQQD